MSQLKRRFPLAIRSRDPMLDPLQKSQEAI
jgi:hypothetical protein